MQPIVLAPTRESYPPKGGCRQVVSLVELRVTESSEVDDSRPWGESAHPLLPRRWMSLLLAAERRAGSLVEPLVLHAMGHAYV